MIYKFECALYVIPRGICVVCLCSEPLLLTQKKQDAKSEEGL